ncbi:MAG: hypothetical protein K9M82_13780, partial [Deltaproteobacteria bacterium]|nr:hypothetical protein [Deltaproteobacteria bacterium]
MYQPDHPYFKDALESFFAVAEDLVNQMSPLVFILSRERFFIDEEPLDPRINVGRLVTHFKKAGIQSVSFYQGLRKNELRLFMEVFTSVHQYPSADVMIKAIEQKGIRHLRINHVYYQKVTSDDEVVSREALKKMTPEMSSEAERKSKKMFLDALLENVLTEEFEKTLSVRNLMMNPSDVSRSLIDHDLAAVKAAGGAETGPGRGVEESADQGGKTGPGTYSAAATTGPASVRAAKTGSAFEEGSGDGPGAGPGQGPGTGPGDGHGTGPEQEPGDGSGQGGAVSTTKPQAGRGSRGAAGVPAAEEGTGGTGLTDAGGGGRFAAQPGTVLAHQLDLIGEEIERSLSRESDVDLQDLAMAVFQMKTELIQGIESQKALGIAYENEKTILEKANDLTDRVLLRIVKDE